MKNTIRKLLFGGVLLLGAGVLLGASADGPARKPVPRPGLFFEESWQQLPEGGENPISQAHVSNPTLELTLYGPDSEQLQVTGLDGNDTNPTHTWSGLCGVGCTFAFRHREAWADFSKGARIMVQSKTSGLHKLRPFIRLADGTTWVGDYRIGQSYDFLYTEFRLEEVRWIAFDTDTGMTKGLLVDDLDLGRVDEIGFTDLQPGAGHGPGGWSDVGTVRVFANAVPR